MASRSLSRMGSQRSETESMEEQGDGGLVLLPKLPSVQSIVVLVEQEECGDGRSAVVGGGRDVEGSAVGGRGVRGEGRAALVAWRRKGCERSSRTLGLFVRGGERMGV